MTMRTQVLIFCIVTTCSDMAGQQCFRRPCCLHLLG